MAYLVAWKLGLEMILAPNGLVDDGVTALSTSIHLGFRSGHKFLIEFLNVLQEVGVNHITNIVVALRKR